MIRLGIALATLVLLAGVPAAAEAQSPGAGDVNRNQTFLRRTVGEDLIDQLDIIWIEQGRVVFSYGNGKLFGIDVRTAMGNPAALRTTTEVKWENFLAEFNSRLVLLAARYPALVHPDGVVVNEKEVFDGLAEPFGDLATEEQIDLAGYLMRNGALGGATEEETMNAFAWIGYLGGTAGAAVMLSQNNVTLPLTFRLQKGEIRGRAYDLRLRVRGDELGFNSKKHPDLSTRLSVRILNFSEARLDLAWRDIFYGAHPSRLQERATYDMRRYGTYYVGAEQTWNPVRERTDLGWLIGAQADVISPGTYEDTRVRTGVEYSLRNTTKLPERYILDLYHRESVDRGRRDFTIQARGAVLVDNIEFRGVGGELRASFLIGSNVPKYSEAYSRADWDRFSRIYVLVGADSAERRKRNYGARIVYAAPFEIDRAFESMVEWLRNPDVIDAPF